MRLQATRASVMSGGGSIDALYRAAGGKPTLDQRFAKDKSLTDKISGNNLITFSRASSGTYVESDGLIKTAAADAPRFDHDPATGESLGLLIEGSRTNQFLYSDDFSSGWTTGSGMSKSQGIVGLSGSSFSISLATSSPFGRFSQDTNIINNVLYTQSVYAKANTTNFVQLAPSRGFPASRVNFQLTGDGTVGDNDTGGTASIEKFGDDGWYRIRLTKSASSSNAAGRIFITLTDGLDGSRLASATGSAYFWGSQLEEAELPSSFIATSASTVTRSPDIVTIESANFSSWYNQSEGTIFADSRNNSGKIVVISDGTDSNRHELFSTSTDITLDQKNGGSSQVSLSQSRSAKSVFAYATDDYALSVGGAAATTDTSATPPTVNKMSIGCQYDDSLQLNGHISRIAYFSSRKADQKLTKMSS